MKIVSFRTVEAIDYRVNLKYLEIAPILGETTSTTPRQTRRVTVGA